MLLTLKNWILNLRNRKAALLQNAWFGEFTANRPNVLLGSFQIFAAGVDIRKTLKFGPRSKSAVLDG